MSSALAPLDQLATDLAAVSFVPGTETAAEDAALLSRARRVLEVKLRLESRRPADAPPVVVIAGGTNVGKSTVFNWVVGDSVASSSPLARHTKAPTVYVHSAEVPALCDGAFLPSYRRTSMQDPADATREPDQGITSYFLKTHDRDEVKGVVLIDCPDIDSTHVNNRAVAEDLLFLADAVVFVATPEKYNDELCVRYLRQATELSKALVCVLNKGADAEVARDFREVVVPGLGGDVTVLTLPYVQPRPDPRTGEPYRAELQRTVLRPRAAAAELRRGAIRGASAFLGRDLQRITARLAVERQELDRVRSEVELALGRRREEFRAFLDTQPFYELDEVFRGVLEEFKIPYLDAGYAKVRGALFTVVSAVADLVRGARIEEKSKDQQRREVIRQKAKDVFEAARTEAVNLPALYAGSLHTAAGGWLVELPPPSVEETNRLVEGYLTVAEGKASEWVQQEKARQVELLRQHPNARNLLYAMKVLLQFGTGLLSAYLTGGIGPADVLVGAAAERMTKEVLEQLGGAAYYQTLKVEFNRAQADLFREALLRPAVADPLLARLPAGVDPERLERVDTIAATLRRGEVPS